MICSRPFGSGLRIKLQNTGNPTTFHHRESIGHRLPHDGVAKLIHRSFGRRNLIDFNLIVRISFFRCQERGVRFFSLFRFRSCSPMSRSFRKAFISGDSSGLANPTERPSTRTGKKVKGNRVRLTRKYTTKKAGAFPLRPFGKRFLRKEPQFSCRKPAIL